MWKILGKNTFGRSPLGMEFVPHGSASFPLQPYPCHCAAISCQGRFLLTVGSLLLGREGTGGLPKRFWFPISSVWGLKGPWFGHWPFWKNQEDRMAVFSFLVPSVFRTSALMEGKSLSYHWPCWVLPCFESHYYWGEWCWGTEWGKL